MDEQELRPETEDRDQRSEVRGQRSEVRGQRSEVRGRRSEVSYEIRASSGISYRHGWLLLPRKCNRAVSADCACSRRCRRRAPPDRPPYAERSRAARDNNIRSDRLRTTNTARSENEAWQHGLQSKARESAAPESFRYREEPGDDCCQHSTITKVEGLE
jgi:hypothetical protein